MMSQFLNSSSHHNNGGNGDKTSEANSCSAPPPLPGHRYEVFLSFTEETRCGFTDYLYKRLDNAGISVFRDKEGLPVGEKNLPELLKAIEASKISIPVISPNYASSEWCLNELVHILKSKKKFNQHVIPIFYRVKPSNVPKTLNISQEEGQIWKKRRHDFDGTHVQEWKDALMEVSHMTGLESEKIANGYEGELVETVVAKVLKALKKSSLVISDELVGVEHHMEKLMSMVNVERSNDVLIILIHGMGGIGKTTLAKVLYNQLTYRFDCCSFLANIRETCSQYKGKVDLQEQFILDVLGLKQSISSVDEGVKIIRDRFKYKKALILLDDVDHGDQLNALAGKPDWFGRGSILIITSRFKNVLKEWEGSFSYELNGLNNDESFLLFCKHAFKESHSIPEKFHTFAKRIVSTTGGLPLAIEVIGRHLRGEDNIDTWEKLWKKLKDIPDNEVQSKLKISFDALEPEEREIFLDVASLPICKNRNFAYYMWESCNFHPEFAIKKLVSMSLIKIGEREELIMHDQLRDLGREIVRQEDINNLGKRSRLWKKEEALKALDLEQGTPNVKALRLFRPKKTKAGLRGGYLNSYEKFHFTSKKFEGMTNLKFLEMANVCLEGDFEKLFLNLRWICSFGSDITNIVFLPKTLVILQLSHDDRISEHWDGWRRMKNLKVLELRHCEHLTMSPDFSAMKRLEVLSLDCCRALRKIHPSIGKLSKTLKVLCVNLCKELTELPVELGKMEELRELCLDRTGIREIPISEGYMTKLETLTARHCKHLIYIPDSLGSLLNLKHLILSFCRSLKNIPESVGKLKWLTELDSPDSKCSPTSIGKLSNLRSLGFSGDSMQTFPDFSMLTNLEHLTYGDVFKRRNRALNLGMLGQLKTLGIYGCKDVSDSKEEIDVAPENSNLLLELPSSLQELRVNICQTLQILPDLSNLTNLSNLRVHGCSELVEINGLDEARSLTELSIAGCKKFSKLSSMGTAVRVLELTSLNALERLPDLSTAKNLGSLKICNCKSLVEIQGIGGAESLRIVTIRQCSSLEKIDGLEERASLTELALEECMSIRYLPDLSKLTNLKSLTVSKCEKLTKIGGLENLRSLEHRNINLSSFKK